MTQASVLPMGFETTIPARERRLNANSLLVLHLERDSKVKYINKHLPSSGSRLLPKSLRVMTYLSVVAGGHTRGLVGKFNYLLCSVLLFLFATAATLAKSTPSTHFIIR
jgi:hypothetical protein